MRKTCRDFYFNILGRGFDSRHLHHYKKKYKGDIMKKELQEKLFKKYPKIFRQRTLPMTETCMCWGIDTGDGWYNLIETLCILLQWDIDNNEHKQIEATQVKEKYGTLRFYTDYNDDKQSGYIDFAEALSANICEECGSNKDVTQSNGAWISTRCSECMKKIKKF